MIRGRHISLRPIEPEDLGAVKRLNDDPHVRANVVGWSWPQSLAEQQRWFEQLRSGTTHRWVVLDSAGTIVGVSGLWDVDRHNRNALTALKLGGVEGVRGRGLGSDAIKTVMAFAFSEVGLHRLHSTILSDNTASRKAYVEKCGWTIEGTARQHVWRHGRFVDLLHVGVLKEEFEALADAQEYVDRICGS